MADIIMDGTDQMIVCPLVDAEWAAVTAAVTDLAINLIINNGSDINLVTAGATLTYSATAGGHKLVIPHASITATGRYTAKISGTNIQNYVLDGLILGDSGFVISPQVAYNQIVGTSKIHPLQIKNLVTGALETTITSATYTYRINGGTETAFTPSPDPASSYSNTMMSFLITVPDTLAAYSYDTIEINCSCTEGEGLLIINVVPAPALIATAVWSGTEGAAVHTATTSTLTLAAINAEVGTAISDAGLVTKIDTVDTVVDGIATTLATPANFMADISNLATSAEITALNDLSEAQVLAQVASALNTYDAPTKAELDTAITNVTVDTSALATSAEIAAAVSELKGTGWTDETLKTLMDAIEAISITASIDAEDVVDAIFNTHLDSTTYDTNDTNRSFGNIIWRLYRVRNYKV